MQSHWKSIASVSELRNMTKSEPKNWLVDPKRGHLLPLTGIWILALDWLLFSSNLMTAGLATPLVVSIGFVLGASGTLVFPKMVRRRLTLESCVKSSCGGNRRGNSLAIDRDTRWRLDPVGVRHQDYQTRINSPVLGTFEKLPVLSAFAPRKLSSFAVLAGSPVICNGQAFASATTKPPRQSQADPVAFKRSGREVTELLFVRKHAAGHRIKVNARQHVNDSQSKRNAVLISYRQQALRISHCG